VVGAVWMPVAVWQSRLAGGWSGEGDAVALTGKALLMVCVVLVVAVVVVTVLGWRRGGRVWIVTRTAGIVVCEASVLFVVGLVVNDWQQVYPSWSALVSRPPAAVPVVEPSARLDAGFGADAQQGAREGLVLAWRPVAPAAWGLPQPVVLFLPPAYFRSPQLRFPVVVVLGTPGDSPGHGGWDDRAVAVTVHAVGDNDVVLLFVRMTAVQAATSAASVVVGTDLPAALVRDVRVGERRWALVATAADAPLALAVLAAQPDRYGSVAVLGDGAAVPPAVLARVGGSGDHAPVALFTVPPATGLGAGGLYLVPTRAQLLPAALRWALGNVPPALAAPITGPVWIPPKPTPHPHPPGPRGTRDLPPLLGRG